MDLLRTLQVIFGIGNRMIQNIGQSERVGTCVLVRQFNREDGAGTGRGRQRAAIVRQCIGDCVATRGQVGGIDGAAIHADIRNGGTGVSEVDGPVAVTGRRPAIDIAVFVVGTPGNRQIALGNQCSVRGKIADGIAVAVIAVG